VPCLEDNDDVVRTAAMTVLTSTGWEPVNDAQRIALAIASKDWSRAAQFGAKAVEPLLRALQQWRLFDSAAAIAEIGDCRINEALIAAYRSSGGHPDIAAALGRLRVKEAIDVLYEKLKEGYLSVTTYGLAARIAAARALGKIGGPLSAQLLVLAGDLARSDIHMIHTLHASKDLDSELPTLTARTVTGQEAVLREIEAALELVAQGLSDKTKVFRVPLPGLTDNDHRTSAKTRQTIKCTYCRQELEYLGEPASLFSQNTSLAGTPAVLHKMEQWRGNVCVQCALVLCPSCIEVGEPTLCPCCNTPTYPAQREYLEQAKIL
jgi:hypothetical protein